MHSLLLAVADENSKQVNETSGFSNPLEWTQEEWVDLVSTYGVFYGFRAMLVIALMFLAWMVSGWISQGVRGGLSRIKFDETLTKFVARLIRWLILLLAVLMCLSYFGVETTSFAAVIGAAGLAVGLAFQGTLSNFAAGAMLLVFRPFKVGDVVNTAGYVGKVNEIAIFTAELDTFDGRRVIIPNSMIFGSVIENITYHPRRRADVDVGVGYSADIDETRKVLEKALESVDLVLEDPEPAVVLLGLGGSSVDWSVRGWALGDNFMDAKQALTRAVKRELDQAGIEIPFPQMDVHLDAPLTNTPAA